MVLRRGMAVIAATEHLRLPDAAVQRRLGIRACHRRAVVCRAWKTSLVNLRKVGMGGAFTVTYGHQVASWR